MPNEATITTPAAGTPNAGKAPATITKPVEKPAGAEGGKQDGKPEPAGRHARLADLVKKAEAKKTEEKAKAKVDGKKPTGDGDKDATGASTATAAESKEKGTDKPANGYTTRRITELETENAKLKSEHRDAFLAEVKKDARVLLRAMGGDGDELLLALAEAHGKEKDPEERIKYEVERQTADLRKKAEDADHMKAENETKAQHEGMLNATRAVLKDGFKEGDEIIVDPAKLKLTAKLTAAGVIDGPAEAMAVVTALVKNARDKAAKEGKAAPQYTNKQAATMLAVAFETIEKRELARKAAYADEPAEEDSKDTDPKSKEGIKEGTKHVRRTLTSRVGYGQTVGREDSKEQPKGRFERRMSRLAKLK